VENLHERVKDLSITCLKIPGTNSWKNICENL